MAEDIRKEAVADLWSVIQTLLVDPMEDVGEDINGLLGRWGEDLMSIRPEHFAELAGDVVGLASRGQQLRQESSNIEGTRLDRGTGSASRSREDDEEEESDGEEGGQRRRSADSDAPPLVDTGSLDRIREARAEAIERMLTSVGRAAGLSADLVDPDDRMFVRDADGRVIDGESGLPLNEQRISQVLAQQGLEDTEANRRQVVLGVGRRREQLLPEGFDPATYIPTEELNAENLGGGSVDMMARAAERRGVETDADGNPIINPATGMPVPGDDAAVKPSPRFGLSHAQRPYRMSTEAVGALQAELVKAGYLSGDFIWGRWDNSSQSAYINLLTYANINGITDEGQAFEESQQVFDGHVQAMVSDYRQQAEQQLPQFNQAAIREEVRAHFDRILGREATAEEIVGLSDQLRGFYQAELRQQMDQQVAGIDPRTSIPEQFGGPPEDAITAEAPGEARDAQAEFAEAFRKRFSKEIDFNSRRESAAESQQAFGSIGSSLFNRALGGI